MLAVALGQVNPFPLIEFYDRWGGTLNFNSRPSRPYWRYQVAAAKAEVCLREILPFLRLKRVEADAALLYRDVINEKGNQGRLTDAETQKRQSVVDEFHRVRYNARTAIFYDPRKP